MKPQHEVVSGAKFFVSRENVLRQKVIEASKEKNAFADCVLL